MIDLPIDAHLPAIVEAVRSRRSLVLVAEPGAGKTTRVPPAIVRAGLLSSEHPNLVMLQPRRVAARAAALRIAEESSTGLGVFAGYHVRFDRQLTPRTRIRVLTEGILTRQLLDDPSLPGVGCVVLDEFHERNINTDLAIAMLREVRAGLREDLILVVMSATLDAEAVASYLGGAPVVRVPGRTFPIDITYSLPSGDELEVRVAKAVERATEGDGDGDVLVFLPGAEEIRRAGDTLDAPARKMGWDVVPLHGSLPAERQYAALAPSTRRKIILATNIAETSLTIDGVKTVIDSGLARVAGFDAERGLDRLDVQRISRSSATQRAGRAGRTAPGQCIRLWTQKEQHQLAEFTVPEIRRVDLCGTVLAIHSWGQSEARKFGWFDPPSESAIESAERLLHLLGALDAESGGRITALGKRLLGVPAHPRIARLLIAAREAGVGEEGAALAAILSEKDFVVGTRSLDRAPQVHGRSDLLQRLELLRTANPGDGVDRNLLRQVKRVADELSRAGSANTPPRVAPVPGDRDSLLLKSLLLAYPDRVCRRRSNDPLTGTMVGGGGVRLARESVVTRAPLFLALDARRDDRSATRESFVRLASAIEPEWLEQSFPNLVRVERGAAYDETKQRVVGRVQRLFCDLVIDERDGSAVDTELAGRVLHDALRGRASQIVGEVEAARDLIARVKFASMHMPEAAWPSLDDPMLADVFESACQSQRSLDDVKKCIVPALAARLPYPLDRQLARCAPETIEVPTGNHIRLDYGSGAAPVLAVRLQELFGLAQTPRVADGRVAVVLHLLGPNYRPVQVTDDLASFWKNTYPQVRKDLRARYPKHSWPDDPLTAPPQAKGSSRRR